MSDGFTLVTLMLIQILMDITIVAWNWRAGTAFTNDASSTGIGSIDSVGSVNTDAGFSIVRSGGTGNGSDATIAHGLGVKHPLFILFKRLEQMLPKLESRTLVITSSNNMTAGNGYDLELNFYRKVVPILEVQLLGVQ